MLDAVLALLPLALLGAVLGLDVVSFPQAMISRPIVASTLAGMLVGAPMQGLLVGALLELFALETLPFGASRYPEWGSAAVVAGALAAQQAAGAAGGIALAVLAGLVTAWVGGHSMVWLRRLNARWARQRLGALDAGSGRTVIGLQLYGMTADLLRGAAMTTVALLLLGPATAYVAARWGLPDGVGPGTAAALGVTVAAAASWKLFHAVPHARLLLAGGSAVGLALVFLR